MTEYPTAFRLLVPGDPRPAGRPRFSRTAKGQVITRRDPADEPGRQAITMAWMQAGRPTVAGPYVMFLHAVRPRAAGHWLNSGKLSATGRRAGAPPGDVDNFAKLPLDTLVKAGAIEDDRHCLGLVVSKSWSPTPDHPGLLLIEIQPREPWAPEKIPTFTWHR